MYKRIHIHFIGIGGIGMSGIAEVLLNLGYPVSGSDIKPSAVTTRLEELGAKIHFQHHSSNVECVDVVVYSSAVAKDNIEIETALREGIPVIRRAEMLAELMRLKKFGIAVAGTHGKTTTTSILASLMQEGDLDPTLVIGGKLNQLGSNAKLGNGDFMIVEADESDGSFLHLTPTIAIVTNVDPDHMENFKDSEHYISAFDEFTSKVPFYGLVVICAEDPEAYALSKRLDRRIQTYGFSQELTWSAQNIQQEGFETNFDLYYEGQLQGRITLNLMGRHNVLNALSCIAVAYELGIPLEKIQLALKGFHGVGRRLELLYQNDGIHLFDDYGHHPTEIRATLSALKSSFDGRLRVLFQPHRYSRLKFLFDDFVNCFELADEVHIAPLYAAGEKPIRGISSQSLYEALTTVHDHAHLVRESDRMEEILLKDLKSGDVLLTLGAGDITQVARNLKLQFEKTQALGLEETHVGSKNG